MQNPIVSVDCLMWLSDNHKRLVESDLPCLLLDLIRQFFLPPLSLPLLTHPPAQSSHPQLHLRCWLCAIELGQQRQFLNNKKTKTNVMLHKTGNMKKTLMAECILPEGHMQ